MEQKKTVWIINHYAQTPVQSGLCRHYYFAKELIKRGYKVHIFTASTIHNTSINMIGKKEKGLFKDIETDGIPYTYVKVSDYTGNGFKRIQNMLGFAYKIKRIWKQYGAEKPDVIYTSSPDIFTAWKAESFAKKYKLPCAVEIRDLWPLSIVEYKGFSNKNPAIKALYRLEKSIYKKSDALVFTMPGGKDYIADKGWGKEVPSDKIFYVNNGICGSDQEAQRQQFTKDDEVLSSNSFKVVYAGSVRTANNVELIIGAAEVIKQMQSERDIQFVIYGDGDCREKMQTYCRDNHVDNVHFMGKVDKKYIPYILQQCNLAVLTYKNVGAWKYGGSQNKLFDYLNAGIPVLANIRMGHSVLAEENCGIELDCVDAQLMAKEIVKLAGLPENEYRQMCIRAKETARKFDYTLLTDRMEKVLQYACTRKEK